jgi:undecaprenyl-diphosphatase
MDIPLWQIVMLAIVQGIAEFLPVSSSGHVVIAAALLEAGQHGRIDAMDLNIVLHLGTLGSILVVYFERIIGLLKDDRRLIGLLAVATVPAVMAGLPLKVYGNQVMSSPLVAGGLLVITGLLLALSARFPRSPDDGSTITVSQALSIGCAQALAILPGLSRSGLTITTGLALRLPPKTAATFSFLMAIPVIAGAGVLETTGWASDSSRTTPLSLLLIGGGVAFLVGIGSLRLLLRWLDQGRFHWFAWWCIPIGTACVFWQIFQR